MTPLPSRYRIIEEVGQGGMAVVYRARDEKLRREVAVKVLHAHLLAEPESKARLEREARAVAKLNHDGILQVFDYSSEEADSSYIVTEFIEGQTLKQFLTNRKLIVPELAALIVVQLGDALTHAHSLGIIHRDVKPENVMVRKDGALKLMDFGVAQVVDLERMTVTGQILGSPAYLAPEVLDGRPLDCRSDVFSVGVMLYQMATGVLPFSGKNPHEVLRRVSEGKFADPRTVNRLVSDQLAKVIVRSLARKPEERYPAIAPMVAELRSYATTRACSIRATSSDTISPSPTNTNVPSWHAWCRPWWIPACASRRPGTGHVRSSCGTAPWPSSPIIRSCWPSSDAWSAASAWGVGLSAPAARRAGRHGDRDTPLGPPGDRRAQVSGGQRAQRHGRQAQARAGAVHGERHWLRRRARRRKRKTGHGPPSRSGSPSLFGRRP